MSILHLLQIFLLLVAISFTTTHAVASTDTEAEATDQTCEVSQEALKVVEEAKNIENPGRQTLEAIRKAEAAMQYPACDSEKAVKFANDAIRQGSAMGNTSESAGSKTGVNCLEIADGTLDASGPLGNDPVSGIFALSTTATASISTTFCLPTASTEASRRSEETAFRDYQQYRFVEKESDNLARDIVRAEGEYLVSMAYLQGCPVEVHGRYAKVVQGNFARIFPHTEMDTADIISNLNTQIAMDPLLARSCKRVS